MPIRSLLAASCLVLLLAFPVISQAVSPLPVDEAAKQPDFFTFRAQLQVAIAKRDKAAVLAVVSKNIQNGFGDDNGINHFKKLWAIDKPNSKLWETLGTLLALGGGFQPDGSFNAPYVSSHWPDVDGFENIAIVGDKVNIRAFFEKVEGRWKMTALLAGD